MTECRYESPRNINSKNSDRKMNPLGKDGRTLTCKACGSFRHMLPESPDSWENMQKLNFRDEDMVLETKYNKFFKCSSLNNYRCAKHFFLKINQ